MMSKDPQKDKKRHKEKHFFVVLKVIVLGKALSDHALPMGK